MQTRSKVSPTTGWASNSSGSTQETKGSRWRGATVLIEGCWSTRPLTGHEQLSSAQSLGIDIYADISGLHWQYILNVFLDVECNMNFFTKSKLAACSPLPLPQCVEGWWFLGEFGGDFLELGFALFVLLIWGSHSVYIQWGILGILATTVNNSIGGYFTILPTWQISFLERLGFDESAGYEGRDGWLQPHHHRSGIDSASLAEWIGTRRTDPETIYHWCLSG